MPSAIARSWLALVWHSMARSHSPARSTSFASAASAIALAVVMALPLGCGVALRAGRPTTPHEGALEVEERATSRCVHGTPGHDGAFREDLPGAVTDPDLLPYLEEFEPAVRRTAVAAGIEPLLARLLRERARVRAGGGSADMLLSMRDELSARMFALETQLLAMEFEIDCVRALINEALGAYAEAETDRQLALTIASLVVGAGTGVASAVWDIANNAVEAPEWGDGPLWTAIVGAVATTALGVAVLVPAPREVVYVHEHNALVPIELGVDDALVYPTFVFRMLTMPMPDGSLTPQGELSATFDSMLEAAVPDESERALARQILFGVGGAHDARLLQLHEELLEEIGAALDSLARDIDLLGSTIAYVLREHDEARGDMPRGEAAPAGASEGMPDGSGASSPGVPP